MWKLKMDVDEPRRARAHSYLAAKAAELGIRSGNTQEEDAEKQ